MMDNFKCKIIKKKGDWIEIVNDCRFTANKPDIDHEPSDKFKEDILIAEHSPIRGIIYKFVFERLPHWVVVHWVRHKWEKYVGTQRVDRTGIDRNAMRQDVEQSMIGEANIQHLIDTERKRLCFMASPETRVSAEELKIEITKDDGFIGNVLVPNCIYRCGCPENRPDDPNRCKFFDNFVAKFPNDKSIFSIWDRYKVYNEFFNLKH